MSKHLMRRSRRRRKLARFMISLKATRVEKKSARTQEIQTEISLLVAWSKLTSVGRLAFNAGMKKTSVRNILRKEIHLTPYKRQASQELRDCNVIRKCLLPENLRDDWKWRFRFNKDSFFYWWVPFYNWKPLQINRTMTNGAYQTRKSDFNSPSHRKNHCLLWVDFDDSYGPALFRRLWCWLGRYCNERKICWYAERSFSWNLWRYPLINIHTRWSSSSHFKFSRYSIG